MTDLQATATTDVIRWTFAPSPEHAPEIQAYLADLGLDVYAGDDGRFTAIWEEPEGDPDEVVEALWEINGEPFEVTHEEFRRTEHLIYEAAEGDVPDGAEPMG